MSGRIANSHTTRRTAVFAAFAALCVAMAGVVGLVLVGLGGRAKAQPSPPPTKNELPKVDRESPLTADDPRRPTAAKFALPDRAIFNRVEDLKPVASQAENSDEYLAWCEFVIHAKQFAQTDLDQVASRELTPVDLLKPNRSLYRTKLWRFDGKVSCVRRLEAPLFFQENPALGVKELYEVRMVPTDESPLTPVSIVFTELPEALAAVKQKAPKEWLDVDLWATASGYFFKTISGPGERGNTAVFVPVLVSKSVTLLPGPPAVPGNNPAAIDKNLKIFKDIHDKTKMPPRPKLTEFSAPYEEPAAYDRVVRHAARFPAEKLEEYARDDLKFADIFLDESHPAYRLDLIKFEGRLIMLRRGDAGEEMKASGIENLYEGWLVPTNEPRGNPIVIVFTEPLEGVTAGNGTYARTNQWVSFAGYYFKKLRYESAEQDPNNPGKYLDKYAPLLIGKGPIARPERDPDRPSQLTWGGFVLAATITAAFLLVSGGILTWYYRKGDRRAKESMDAVRNRNPFDPANATTSAPPPT
jgi:hypothetical protein